MNALLKEPMAANLIDAERADDGAAGFDVARVRQDIDALAASLRKVQEVFR